MQAISRVLAALFFLALGACLLLSIQYTAVTPNTFLWQELKNFGHTPLFFLIALTLVGAFVNLPGIRSRRRTTVYLLALAVLPLLAAGSEAMQLVGPRDADLMDFARDLAGAVSALALLATFDSRLREEEPWKRRGFRLKARLAALLLLLITFIPVAIWLEGYRRRSAQMPVLMSFAAPWELRWVEENGVELELVSAPGGWDGMAGKRVGKVTFAPGRFPGLVFREPYPDWSSYSRFSLALYADVNRPVDVVLRIDDAHVNDFVEDRFNLRVTLHEGANVIQFPLEQVREAPERREMDLSEIGLMVLFAVRPDEPFSLYLSDMKLE